MLAVAELVSYFGGPDAVLSFTMAGALSSWRRLATALRGDERSPAWPSLEEGSLPAAQRLVALTADPLVRQFVAIAIDAFVEKAELLNGVLVAAGELRAPEEATQEVKDYFRDPTRSRAFYYLTDDGAPINLLPNFSMDDGKDDVDCEKTVLRDGLCNEGLSSVSTTLTSHS